MSSNSFVNQQRGFLNLQGNAIPNRMSSTGVTNLYSYVASLKPNESDALLIANKYPRPLNHVQRVQMLSNMVVRQGNEGLAKIAMIHPDKSLIEYSISDKSESLNCDGCDKCESKNKLSLDGGSNILPSPIINTDSGKGIITEKTLNTLIIAGSITLTAVIITMMVSNIIAVNKK